MGFPDSDGVSRVPSYLGAGWNRNGLRARGCHPLWRPFPEACTVVSFSCRRSRNPWGQAPRFGLFRVRSPLLAESLLISFPRGTEMFHFPRYDFFTLFDSCEDDIPRQDIGLLHSEICGSNGSLHLTTAYRSLPRPSSSSTAKASAICSFSLAALNFWPDD